MQCDRTHIIWFRFYTFTFEYYLLIPDSYSWFSFLIHAFPFRLLPASRSLADVFSVPYPEELQTCCFSNYSEYSLTTTTKLMMTLVSLHMTLTCLRRWNTSNFWKGYFRLFWINFIACFAYIYCHSTGTRDSFESYLVTRLFLPESLDLKFKIFSVFLLITGDTRDHFNVYVLYYELSTSIPCVFV